MWIYGLNIRIIPFLQTLAERSACSFETKPLKVDFRELEFVKFVKSEKGVLGDLPEHKRKGLNCEIKSNT